MSGEKIKQVNILFCAWNKDEIWETDYIVDTIIPQKYIRLYSHLPESGIQSLGKCDFDVFVYNCRNHSYDFILSCVTKIKPKIIIHLSDEYYYENLNYWNDLAQHCDLFLRQHHHPGFTYRDNVIQMPLGYCNDAGLNGKCIPTVKNRCFEWSFLGDMKHDRWDMVNHFKSVMPNNYVDCFVDKPRMVDIYLNSVFVPNGRGNSSLNCFRLYEASMCGSIPVVVGNEDEIKETFKYEENPPWLFYKSWDEASSDCGRLLSDEKSLQLIQNNILNWWEKRIKNIHTKIEMVIDNNKDVNEKEIKFIMIGASDGNDAFLNYFKTNNVKFSQAIFIDPLPENAEKILENYKEFSNVSVETCVVMQPLVSYYADDNLNNVKFYRHLEESEISTTKYEHIIYHSSWFDANKVEEISVKRRSLEQIFNQNKIQDCDWVVIDAEGCDAEIILSFDWEKYCVSRIEFEHIHLNHYAKAVNLYLTSMGYVQVPSVDEPDNVAYENLRIIQQKDVRYCIDKMKDFPNIHYISVVDDSDRRDLLHKKFKEYGVEETKLFPHLFERYDDSTHNVITEFSDWKLSLGSRGPVTSHLKAIKEWYETTDEPYAFFCEDDLSLDTVKYWQFTWNEFFNSLPKDWDCVQLVLLRETFNLFNNGFRHRCWCDWSACAYLITRNHAKNLIQNYYPESNNTFYLDNKSVDIHAREEWAKIPVVETTLFSNFGDGKIYSCPLFVEDVINCNSSYLNLMGFKQGQCDKHHENSYSYYMNWWKTDAQYKTLSQVYTY